VLLELLVEFLRGLLLVVLGFHRIELVYRSAGVLLEDDV
jgi:hypothetical protein